MSHDTRTTRRTLAQARAARVDDQTRQAQARLADKSFSAFMREHNARQTKPFEPNPRSL